jgi:hypothetical protein
VLPRRYGQAGRIALFAVLLPAALAAYGFLTHEAIIDLAWEDTLKPRLLAKYPATTPEELQIAHSYAYGGSVIQDLGYYPFGSQFFSDLVHYVRTGDFVRCLIKQSRDVNELAFAYGALAHYAADTGGHPAVNLSVALTYPQLKPTFGNEVTYEQDKKAHLKVEFGFDMYQAVTNRYAQQDYHERLGFRVAQELLERSFAATYGLSFNRVFKHPHLAIGSYRFAISRLLPEITRAAVLNRHDQIIAERPDFAERQFLFKISKTEYRKQFGSDYEKPGLGTRILSFFFRHVSHSGALTALDAVNPTPQTQDYFVKSVDFSLRRYREFVAAAANNNFSLRNWNFDTGRDLTPNEYGLADDAYARLLLLLSKDGFTTVDTDLKQNIIAFYDAPPKPRTTKDSATWDKVTKALAVLRMQ